MDSFEACFEWAINELKEINAKVEELDGKKREIILELARRLEESGMPKDMISEEISKRLDPYMSDRYIQGCLTHEYKNQKKSTRTMANTSSIDRKKVLVTVSNIGEQRQRLPQPRNLVDAIVAEPQYIINKPTNDKIKELQQIVDGQRERIFELEQLEKERIKQSDIESPTDQPDTGEPTQVSSDINSRTSQPEIKYEKLSRIQLVEAIQQVQKEVAHLRNTHSLDRITIDELKAALTKTSFTPANQLPKTKLEHIVLDLQTFGANLIAMIQRGKSTCIAIIDDVGNVIDINDGNSSSSNVEEGSGTIPS
jgi:hypothetical protein